MASDAPGAPRDPRGGLGGLASPGLASPGALADATGGVDQGGTGVDKAHGGQGDDQGGGRVGGQGGGRVGATKVKARGRKRDPDGRGAPNPPKRAKSDESALAEALRRIDQPGGYPRTVAALRDEAAADARRVLAAERAGRVANLFVHALKPEALLDDARVGLLAAVVTARIDELKKQQVSDVALKAAKAGRGDLARLLAAVFRRAAAPAMWHDVSAGATVEAATGLTWAALDYGGAAAKAAEAEPALLPTLEAALAIPHLYGDLRRADERARLVKT